MRQATAVAAALLATGFGWILGGTAHALNITRTPEVRRDLVAAVAYWHAAAPQLKAPACTVQVVRRPMQSGVRPVGYVAAADVLAETELGGCEIGVSWELAEHLRRHPHERIACELLTHEYGHVLGLPDETDAGSIMSVSEVPGENLVPQCARKGKV